MFRRRTDTEEPPKTPEVVKPAGKGRPTPKRREAERRNRRPITAPRTRKEAYRQRREQLAAQRREAREGMARGDDRYLLKRDRGPVKRLARDYVDSRRTFAEYFMYITFLVLIGGMVAPQTVRVYLSTFGWMFLLVIIVGESMLLSARVKRLAKERFPNESTRGVGFYTVTRAMQIRRFRMPQPRLKPGQQNEV